MTNLLFDNISPKRKSIHDIKKEQSSESYSYQRNSVPEYKKKTSQRSKKIFFYIFGAIGIVLIIAIFISVSKYFGSSTISIIPKKQMVTLKNEVKAYIEAGKGDITYSYIEITDTQKATIKGEKKETVSQKAKGTIIISNNYSKEPQTLIASTRFASEDKMIYRLEKTVSIPGNGSIEAVIVADKPGVTYNKQKAVFTIPGFAGKPQEGKITAKASTPISGGFEGKRMSVDEVQKAKIVEELKQSIAKNLDTKNFESKTNEILVFTVKKDIEYTEPLVSSVGQTVTIELTGKAKRHAISNSELASFISKKFGSSAETAVEIKNIENLSVVAAGEYLSITSQKPIIVQSIVKKEDIIQISLGKNKNELETELNTKNTIELSTIKLTPPWLRTLPKDPSSITVSIQS